MNLTILIDISDVPDSSVSDLPYLTLHKCPPATENTTGTLTSPCSCSRCCKCSGPRTGAVPRTEGFLCYSGSPSKVRDTISDSHDGACKRTLSYGGDLPTSRCSYTARQVPARGLYSAGKTGTVPGYPTQLSDQSGSGPGGSSTYSDDGAIRTVSSHTRMILRGSEQVPSLLHLLSVIFCAPTPKSFLWRLQRLGSSSLSCKGNLSPGPTSYWRRIIHRFRRCHPFSIQWHSYTTTPNVPLQPKQPSMHFSRVGEQLRIMSQISGVGVWTPNGIMQPCDTNSVWAFRRTLRLSSPRSVYPVPWRP